MMTGKADLGCEFRAVANIVHQRGARHIQPDARHGVFEQQPVFRFLDGFEPGANHFHVVFLENAGIGQIDGKIQRRLPSYCRQQGEFAGAAAVGIGHPLAFPADDLFYVLPGQRLDIGAVGKLRIGHDGGRVGIHQHHLIAFGLERLAGLRARVIELRRLPNHDRPGADHENFRYIVPAWHLLFRSRALQVQQLSAAEAPVTSGKAMLPWLLIT